MPPPKPTPPSVEALRASLQPRGGPGDAHYRKRFGQLQFDPAAVTVDGDASVFPFTVTEAMVNSVDTLHGGNAAWVVDTFSSVHATAVLGHRRHVTVQLDLKYHAAPSIGTRCAVLCYLRRAGRRVAFLEARIVKAADHGVVFVVADHVKALSSPPPAATKPHAPSEPPLPSGAQETASAASSEGSAPDDRKPASKL